MKLDLVFNPASGKYRENRFARLVGALEGEGFAVEPFATSPRGANWSGAADLVCVYGGDGALRDTVKAMGAAAGEVPLCVAPAGTINLVARELGYSREPEELARQVAIGWRRGAAQWPRSPLFRLGDVPVVACCSAGPDSIAVNSVSHELKGRIGRYAYLAAGMGQLRNWPRGRIALRGELASGEPFETEAEAMFAARSRLYAGPFRLSPRAALATDSFELVTMSRASRRASLAFAGAVAARLPLEKLRLAEIRSVSRVEMARCDIPLQVDGDPVEPDQCVIAPAGFSLAFCI